MAARRSFGWEEPGLRLRFFGLKPRPAVPAWPPNFRLKSMMLSATDRALEGFQKFYRLGSGKGGDERIRGVGKLMERANRTLKCSTGEVSPRPECDFGRKRTAGFAGLARPYHFFRKRAAGASKSHTRAMLEMEKG